MTAASPHQRAVPPSAPASITDDEFDSFNDFFYEKTGIVFGAAKRYFVDRRLIERIEATLTESARAYLLLLRHGDTRGEELQRLINLMTVNETYFYREEYQFRCLVASILPEIAAARQPDQQRPIRLWSVPCSTGEEPYSIAIYLLENWPAVDRYDIEIVASDIDTRVMQKATTGLYDDRAVHYLPEVVKARYFTRSADGRWRIKDTLRESIDFAPVNISDRKDMYRHRNTYDVIFCRNLLIYFDDKSRRQAAEALFDSLRPGGFLCLGHSESMSRISSLFHVRKFRDAIVYQKPTT